MDLDQWTKGSPTEQRKKITIEDIKELERKFSEIDIQRVVITETEVAVAIRRIRNAFTMLGIAATEEEIKLAANQTLWFSKRNEVEFDYILLRLCNLCLGRNMPSLPPEGFEITKTDL